CARSALYLRGIPAFAGMTEKKRNDRRKRGGMTEKSGNGGYLPCEWVVFRADLDFRSFYTACFAGMAGWGRGMARWESFPLDCVTAWGSMQNIAARENKC
ncbi:MAG: hypothetical protein OXU43_02450, partial [Gammaproteobacteria bacterium]|nr:hypothetical protein [Gammaproteobacteria bacterium]